MKTAHVMTILFLLLMTMYIWVGVRSEQVFFILLGLWGIIEFGPKMWRNNQ